jgi:hypothetical protein
MRYDDRAPYEVLATPWVDFSTLQRLKRFAKLWDTVANRGNFRDTLPLLLGGPSAFEAFLAFTDWVWGDVGRVHSIALDRLVELVRVYASTILGIEPLTIEDALRRDYTRVGRTKLPSALRPKEARQHAAELPRRQARHRAS